MDREAAGVYRRMRLEEAAQQKGAPTQTAPASAAANVAGVKRKRTEPPAAETKRTCTARTHFSPDLLKNRGNGRVSLLLAAYRGPPLTCGRCRRALRNAPGGKAHTRNRGCVLFGTKPSTRGGKARRV